MFQHYCRRNTCVYNQQYMLHSATLTNWQLSVWLFVNTTISTLLYMDIYKQVGETFHMLYKIIAVTHTLIVISVQFNWPVFLRIFLLGSHAPREHTLIDMSRIAIIAWLPFFFVFYDIIWHNVNKQIKDHSRGLGFPGEGMHLEYWRAM